MSFGLIGLYYFSISTSHVGRYPRPPIDQALLRVQRYQSDVAEILRRMNEGRENLQAATLHRDAAATRRYREEIGRIQNEMVAR